MGKAREANEPPLATTEASENPADPLASVQQAVDALQSIDVADQSTTFMDVLQCVAAHALFEIPDSLKAFVDTDDKAEPEADEELAEEDEESEETSGSLGAWRAFLETSYNQVTPYSEYVADIGAFGTHQGVKGLEFDRVLVIMDDSEARGFLFSYEKLLGAKPPTNGDLRKIDEGAEIGPDRTRRLLYVTCTRAERSLALMAYTNDPDLLETAVIQQGWFELSEIERL